jgi:predicted neuraminidase
VENKKPEFVPSLNDFLAESETEFEENVFSGMIRHLICLHQQILEFFLFTSGDGSWVRNIFSVMEMPYNMPVQHSNVSINISYDIALK